MNQKFKTMAKIIPFAVLAMLAMVLISCQTQAVSAASGRTLYVFGDSWSAEMAEGQFQAELSERNLDGSVNIQSYAIGGTTLEQWAADENEMFTALLEAIEEDPHPAPIVFFTLGGNDILEEWATPVDLAEPFEDVLVELIETRSDVQVVVGNYDFVNPNIDSDECNSWFGERFDSTEPRDINPIWLDLNETYQAVANQFDRVQVVNTYGTLQGQPGNPDINTWSPQQYLADCIHLTDAGYARYLDTIFSEALSAVINSSPPENALPQDDDSFDEDDDAFDDEEDFNDDEEQFEEDAEEEDVAAPAPTAAPPDHHMPPSNPGTVTNTVAASGNWRNATTWQGSQLPSDNAVILIPMGQTLTIDSQLTPKFKSIQIEGTLRFAPNVNTELWVDTIWSGQHGTLEIGTVATPIDPNVTARIVFADLGPIDRSIDPTQVSRGAVLMGPTHMHGAAKTHRITVATFPTAGTTSLQLSSAPVGWQIGDEIVITGTQGSTSDEVRNITAINGSTVTLDQPLALDHVPPKAELNLWVANLTRNIRIESENTGDVSRRGHIMFMHNNNVTLNYAGFYGLGRTDKREELDDWYYNFADLPGNDGPSPIHFTAEQGPANNIRGRYALHVHRAGTDPNSTPVIFKGSVVQDSPGWGFVNHSSNVNMIDNVSYAIQGAGFYTEAGDEIGAMIGNIAIRTVNDYFRIDDLGAIDPDLGLDRGDFGNDGDGFWLSGTRVSLIDNVSAGASAHGFIFWTDGLIEPDTGRATVNVSEIANGHLFTNRNTIPVWWAPLAEVRNNESYGATVGFRSRYIHSEIYMGEDRHESAFHATPPQAYLDTLNPVFDGITVWGSRDGILLNYNEGLSLRNARVIGIAAPFQHNLGQTAAIGVGVDYNNEATSGPGFIENVTIEGFEMGLLAPRQGTWQISNLTLQNVTDIMFHEPNVEQRTMTMSNINFGTLAGTAVSGRDGERRNIVLDMYFDNFLLDPNLLVAQDRITLDGYDVYFDQQTPSFVPYGEEIDIDPESGQATLNGNYLGKTNQQLWDQYGVAFGGELLPANAVNDARIVNGKLATTP